MDVCKADGFILRACDQDQKKNGTRGWTCRKLNSELWNCERLPDNQDMRETMKFVVAKMKHETNTFSPVPTPFKSFANQAAYYGADAYDAFKGTNTPMAAFIDPPGKREQKSLHQ